MVTPRKFRCVCVALAAFLFLGFLSGCGERGDKAISYGTGLGEKWRRPVGVDPPQMRIAVQNLFTRDVRLVCQGKYKHYELTTGPLQERYMIVPDGQYEITAFSPGGRDAVFLFLDRDDRVTSKGIVARIRSHRF